MQLRCLNYCNNLVNVVEWDAAVFQHLYYDSDSNSDANYVTGWLVVAWVIITSSALFLK